MKKVFIDTNILLDVLAKRAPFYPASATVWTLAETGKIMGMISTLSFNNIYYIMRRQSGGAGAKMAIRLLHGIFSTVPPDNQILNQALDSELADFDDALQFFSALHAGASCIVTRNPGDFPAGHIPILTPEEFLAANRVKLLDATYPEGAAPIKEIRDAAPRLQHPVKPAKPRKVR